MLQGDSVRRPGAEECFFITLCSRLEGVLFSNRRGVDMKRVEEESGDEGQGAGEGSLACF